jgi:hypothetical protein
MEFNAFPLLPPWSIVSSIEDGSRSCQVLRKVLVDGTERSRRNGIFGCRLYLSAVHSPDEAAEAKRRERTGTYQMI